MRYSAFALAWNAIIGQTSWPVEPGQRLRAGAHLVPRSFAESFLHWLTDSAAEFRAPTAATTGS